MVKAPSGSFIPVFFVVAVFLLCHPAGTAADRSIHEAGQTGDWGAIERLVRGGADINAKDLQGRTALHYAAKGGHMGTVKALLQKGADPNVLDNEGRTALDYAVQGGHDGTAQELRPVTHAQIGRPASSAASGVPTLSPSAKYRDLESFQLAIGQPACLLKSEHVYFFAPKARETQAKVVFPYLVRAYDELYRIVGVHTEYILAVYNFPKGNREGWGGTGNCRIEYDDTNLRLDQQDEWIRYKVPHVSGYIEEMAHNFVSRTKAQFGWEMIGWSLGVKVCGKVAPDPLFSQQVKETREEQAKTYRRYLANHQTFPSEIAANLVDRIHAYLLWRCENRYGPKFWSDFFRNINRRYPELCQAAGGKSDRDARYRITVDCFDALPGLHFKKMLDESGISLTRDIKSLRPTEPGWNRKLM